MWRSTLVWPTAMVAVGMLTLVIAAQSTNLHRSQAEAQEAAAPPRPATRVLSDRQAKEGGDSTEPAAEPDARTKLLLELRGKLPEFDPYRGTAYESIEGAPGSEQGGRSRDPIQVRDARPLVVGQPLVILAEPGEQRLLHALRETARLLEEAADRDEWTNRYSQADQARRLAKRLRRQARQLSASVATPHAAPAVEADAAPEVRAAPREILPAELPPKGVVD